MKKQNKGIVALKILLYFLLFICVFVICILSFEPTELNIFRTGFGYDSNADGTFAIYNSDVILMKINYLGYTFNTLYDFRYVVLAVSAAIFVLIICLEATTPARKHKRYKKGLIKIFNFYGEKFIEEDKELDY